MNGDLELALSLGAMAADMAMPFAGRPGRCWPKRDGSPVTETDIAVELAIVEALARACPNDGVLGEETGVTSGGSGRTWIVDPVDGTSSFVGGGRSWGTHIALVNHNKVVAAVLTRPTENRCWWASAGSGAYRGQLDAPGDTAESLRLAEVTNLRSARVGGLLPAGSRLPLAIQTRATWVEDEVSIIAALLEGRVDAVVDIGGEPWDMAPATLLVPEAGGCFRDPCGGTRIDLGKGLYTHWSLYSEISELLAENGYTAAGRT